jgi:hypothetical protein
MASTSEISKTVKENTEGPSTIEGFWRAHLDAKSKGEAKSLFDRGYKLAANISKKLTYNDAIKDKSLATTNLAWYSHLNRKSPHANGKVVGIFANSRILPGQYEATNTTPNPFGASSEWAVYMMAKELAKMGYHVVVFCDFDTKIDWQYTIPLRNPQYLPISRENSTHLMGPTIPGFILSFDDIMTRPEGLSPLDELIVWCCPWSQDYVFHNYAKNVHAWYINFYGSSISYDPKTIYVLSEFHKAHTLEKNQWFNPADIIVGCMGTDVHSGEEVITKKRRAKSCMYATSRIRGLLDLMKMWGDILAVHPTATLTIAYGKQTFMSGTEAEIAEIDGLIAKYKKSVFDVDRLPIEQLKKVVGQQSFYLYPYKTGDHLTETFSTMVAMAGRLGTIPIVRRRHGLLTTAAPQDGDLLGEGEFLARTIEMLGKDEEELRPIRKTWYDHCKQYTWENAAKTMASRFSL